MKRRPIKNRLKERLKEVALRPFKCPVGTSIFVIGLSGLSGDAEAWQRAIDKVTRDERVLALAEQAAAFGSWVNQPSVRVAFVLVGVLLILWRVQWFWRLRHKLLYGWRRLLADDVWIDRDAAMALLRNSTWGELKRPMVSAFDGVSNALTGGLTAGQRVQRKFTMYLEFTLESFAADNPYAVRIAEGGEEQFEEGALRRFAREAMREDVEAEFGAVPKKTV